jgi:hypothetical protein
MEIIWNHLILTSSLSYGRQNLSFLHGINWRDFILNTLGIAANKVRPQVEKQVLN